MSSFPENLPVYTPETFVNRDEDIRLVQGIARQISEGERKNTSTIVFHGERGVGKTWLSLHLKRKILPDIPGVTVLLVSFFPTPKGLVPKTDEWFHEEITPLQQLSPEKLAQKLVTWVAQQVGATTTSDATLREQTGWLARDVENTFKHRSLVLILDSIFEVNWEILAKLEESLLAPLVTIPRFLVIMTGRGRLYPWESPYLRVDVTQQALHPFTHEHSKTQLQQHAPGKEASVDRIVEFGGGYPLNNILLARSEDEASGLVMVADALLSVIDPEKRPLVRQYFEALCVLDGFRESEIPPMLAARSDNPMYEDLTPPDTRQVRDTLLETHLIRWEEGRFVMDESIRTILDHLLKNTELSVWQRLHCRAYKLYLHFAQEFSRYQEHYNARATKHANELATTGIFPENCFTQAELVRFAELAPEG